jgi:hypothetical protein
MKFLQHPFNRWLCLFIAMFQLAAVAGESPWQRIVVVGASASAGFVLSEPFGGTNTANCKLNRYLDAAITAPHAPVKNLASALMFMNPETFGPMQIDAATNAKPTLVIGVDFLFWFCYGDGATDAERAQRFEDGLKLLEQIPCPLLVGDIPDASAATNTGIISAEQVPSDTARRAANKRLRAWAAAHPHVTVVPLAEFMRATMANAAIKVHNGTLSAGKTRALLQADQLHPNPRGAAVLTLGILDALVSQHPIFSAGEICWDPEKVFRDGLKSAQPPAPKPQ